MKPKIAFLCVLALVWSVLWVPAGVAAETIDPLLGSVSAKYESNGDAGTISGGEGDLGGASFGAYQFAATYDVPLTFARWCVSSGANAAYGQQLVDAYQTDGKTFGTQFRAVWKEIAAKDPQGFLLLQRQYVKVSYYDPAVAALENNFNLQIQQYGIAFQNAVWSRTLQHGLGSYDNRTGFLGILRTVEESVPQGILHLTEEELITAIYEESGGLTTTGRNAMTVASSGGNAWIVRQYELEGKYMKYFSGNSSAVQAGVYLRLRVNELTELLEMLAQYGGYEGQGNLLVAQPFLQEQWLILSNCNQMNGWSGGTEVSLGLADLEEQGEGALLILPLSLEPQADATATLTFEAGVNMNGGEALALNWHLPVEVSSGGITILLHHPAGDVTQIPLDMTGSSEGWQTATLSLPHSIDQPVTAVTLDFTNLPGELLGKRILLDSLWVALEETMVVSATVIADALNCRKAPGTQHAALGQYLWGESITVVGKASSDGWYYCMGQGSKGQTLVGWCSGDYLTFDSFSPSDGDLNGDKTVNAVDALLVLQFAVDKVQLSALQQTLADMDKNEIIDAVDALMILQYAVGK